MSNTVYSQHEEQTIIESILGDHTLTPTAVEIGINTGAKGDGSTLQGNTVFLKLQGWDCKWIDARTRHPDVITNTVYPENVMEIIGDQDPVGIFSIDIDGEDWHVVRSVLTAKRFPEMFVCELNSYLDPAKDLVMPLNHRRQGMAKSICHGATLTAFDNLLSRYGYRFQCATRLGTNGFWLRDDIAKRSASVSNFQTHRHPCTTNWSRTLPTDRWISSEILLASLTHSKYVL